MVHGGILLNQTLVAHFSVVGKALHIISSTVICMCIRVLNNSMWSKESVKLSHDSSWVRQNFGGRGRFNSSLVNGESVLQIILSKFSMAFSLQRPWVRPFLFSCYEVRFPSWTNSLLTPFFFCWSGCRALLHCGSLQSLDVAPLHFDFQ